MPEKAKKPTEKKSISKTLKSPVYYEGIGRRKRAVARVRLYEKSGPFFVDEKPIEEYFPGEEARLAYLFPIHAAVLPLPKFSVTIKVKGGGKKAQLGAVVVGLARAILKFKSETKSALKKRGLLTRDSREKEPKKWGRHRARKKWQFSKR